MSTVPHLRVAYDEDKRRLALELLRESLRIPPVKRIVQRGREPDTARFAIELQDGRTIRVGTAQVLFSQARLSQVLAVTLSCATESVIPPKEWRKMIAAIFNHAVDVEEAPGESFEDIVTDWLRDYARSPGADADGCAAKGRPFVRDGWLHIHAQSFAVHVRRSLHGQFGHREMLQALVDIGFERKTVNYTHGGRRTTTSLYRAPCDILAGPTEPEQP